MKYTFSVGDETPTDVGTQFTIMKQQFKGSSFQSFYVI